MTTPSVFPVWSPSPDAVADLLAQRVLVRGGQAVGTFTAATKPTAAQVQRIADAVAREVEIATGPLPADYFDSASDVAALGAAARVELSFFPRDTERGTYDDLAVLYTAALARLVLATRGGQSEGRSSAPVFGFPVVPPWRSYEAWL